MSTDSRLGNIGNILSGGAARPRLVPSLPPDEPVAGAAETAGQAIVPQPATAPAAPQEPGTRAQAPRRPSTPSQTPAKRKKPAADRDTVHRVPVRLDADLRERLDLAARARESSLSEVAFDAIEEAHRSGVLQQLAEDDGPDGARPARRPAGSLFQRPQGRPAAQSAVMTEFRFTGPDLEVLDRLVGEAGATSRSQLIKVTLRQHLATED